MSFVSLFIVIYVLSVFCLLRYTKIYNQHAHTEPPPAHNLLYARIVRAVFVVVMLFVYIWKSLVCSVVGFEHVFDVPPILLGVFFFCVRRLASVALMQ